MLLVEEGKREIFLVFLVLVGIPCDCRLLLLGANFWIEDEKTG
jgi:hypothetical protein